MPGNHVYPSTMVEPWLHGLTMVLAPGLKFLLKPRRDFSILNMKGNTKCILVVLVVK